ncbi:MAG TPA: SRPBCC domain-containing protein [Candidatus Limnocylindrales bacterium]|jgi:uncharacterized protein YndB with AHSA1/START domain
MPGYHVTRQINAPAERVWDLLTDATGYAKWNRAVISIDGPIAMGETIALVSIANPKRVFKLKITDAARPSRLVWSDGMPLGLFKGERTYLLTEENGGTAFSMSEAFTGPLAGMMVRAIPDLTDSFALFADSLKNAAEVEAT